MGRPKKDKDRQERIDDAVKKISTTVSAVQQQAIEELMQGKSVSAVAAVVGVHPTTVRTWMSRDKEFIAAYRECRRVVATHAMGLLQSSASFAASKLISFMTDPKATRVQLEAAKAVLDKAFSGLELDELEERLERLEEEAKGPREW